MRGFRRVTILPALLDRSYSLVERLSVWFYGETYQSKCGETRLKPYAIYRQFNKDGYSITDPYRNKNTKINSLAERRHYEKSGLVFRNDHTRKVYNENKIATKKLLYSIKQLRKINQ